MMTRRSLLKLIFGIGLALAFFLDGSLMYLFSAGFSDHFVPVPSLTLLWLILSFCFVRDRQSLHLEIWAAVIGLVFDLYYTGILGFYVFAFPLVIYLTRKLFWNLSVSFLSALVIYELSLIIVIGLSYLVNGFVAQLTQTGSLPLLIFLVRILLPTLLFNLILFGILYFPIRSLFNSCQRSKNDLREINE